MPLRRLTLALPLAALAGAAVAAPDISARQVVEALFAAKAGAPADLAGRSLEGLDLAGLDFKGARLAGADLFGTDLSRTRLARADLTGARLDRAVVIRTDFTEARLNGATLRSLTVFQTVEPDPRDAPRFTAADMTGTVIVARLDGASFAGANLTDAKLGPQPAIWGSYTPRAMLIGADFSAAEVRRTDLRKAVLHFARFVNANVVDSDLAGADLSGADFTGAEVRGTDFTAADFDGTVLRNVKGLDQAIGLDQALNLDKAVR